MAATDPTPVETFDAAYVKTLRAENADTRAKLRAAEAELRPVLKKGYLPPDVKPATTDVEMHVHKFPKGDVENFSLARAALAKAKASASPQMRTEIWEDVAPWEFAYLNAMRDVRFKANMGDAVSGQDGGYLAPEFWSSQWFDVLRSLSAIDQLPVQRFNIPLRVAHIAKVTNDVTIYYPGENGTATTSVYKLGQVTYTARKAVAYYRAGNELIRDAGDLVDDVFRQSTAAAIAIDRDTQIFVGSTVGGTASPSSFVTMALAGQVALYYPGSSTTTPLTASARTGTPFFQTIAQLINKVEALNGNTSVSSGQAICDGFATNAQFKQTLFGSSNFFDNSLRPLWMTDPSSDGGFFGGRWALSNAIPTSTTVSGVAGSLIVAGWWRQFGLYECKTLGFDSTLHSQAFANDETEIRVIHRWDAAPIHPEAFVVLAGVAV